MKTRFKNHVKVIMLFCVALLMFNCQNEDTPSSQPQDKIQTVTIDEAKSFLVYSKSNTLAKSANKELDDFDYDKIAQEKINGSNQLLTIIPFAGNTDFENNRVLLLKIDNEIKSVVFSMYPDENSVKESFSGKIFIYSLDEVFLNGYRIENGDIVSQFVKSNAKASLTSKQDGEALKEVIVQQKSKGGKKYVNYFEFESIWGNSGGSSSGGGNQGLSWDSTGGGGSNNNSTTVVAPPSCQSFNFIKTTSLWQVALVKNITFTIVLLDGKGAHITHRISYPQAISFGSPTNLQKGGANLTAGMVATLSARALQTSIQEVVDRYGAKDVSEMVVDQYFRDRLVYNYPLFINGGRANFNSTDNLPATDYKTTLLFLDDCDK